jgi:hypothetical protein
MQTPLPAQIEHWIAMLENKKNPSDVKDVVRLHLSNIRAIIDASLEKSTKASALSWRDNKDKATKHYENMSAGRHAHRNSK